MTGPLEKHGEDCYHIRIGEHFEIWITKKDYDDLQGLGVDYVQWLKVNYNL